MLFSNPGIHMGGKEVDEDLNFIKGYLDYYRELEAKKLLYQNLFFTLAILMPSFFLFLFLENILFFDTDVMLWIKVIFISLGIFILLRIHGSISSLKKTSYSQLAVLLERKFPHFDTHLINAWQLGDSTVYPHSFISRLTEDAKETIHGTDPARAVDLQRLSLYRKMTFISMAVFLIYALLSPGNFKNGLLRIIFPSRSMEKEIRVEPGNAAIEKGSSLTIRVYLKESGTPPLIEIKNTRTEKEELAGEKNSFLHYIPEVREDFSYRIIYGGRKTTGWFRIEAKDQTLLKRMSLTYTFPAYTGQKEKREEKEFGEISALHGTKIALEVMFTNPAGDTYLIFGNGHVFVNRGVAEKKVFYFNADGATLYQFRYYDPLTRKFKETSKERINVTLDTCPYVEFISPGKDIFAEGGKTVAFKVRAKDDFGLTSIRIKQQIRQGRMSEDDPVLYRTAVGKKTPEFTADTIFRTPSDFREPVVYYAECVDNCPQGNTGLSSVYYIYPPSERKSDKTIAEKTTEQEAARRQEEIIKTDLEKFASEEKDIIEAAKRILESKDLRTEKGKIDDIAESQQRWADLFQKMVDDLHKIGKQTQGKFTLADELVEMLSHLQLSNEHLARKAVHLAIPESETGLELAKEITSNIERWLSKYPDYLKWDMEEPSAMHDVPEAELPDELEDVIGELLEQEEDMRDEIEDITSSWMDSLDKGAGWGVADGPISNMSAKGITGNLMPNQQEIGGRSGEGRTGRSYGEMVEKTATGKGGRKTPARLTPDNLEPGEIQDTSGEQPSGPTGGGKASGLGAQGLTGPVQDLNFRYNILSQKQQKLIEKTESLIRNMQVMNVYNPEMERALGGMKEFQMKLREGKYTELLSEKQRIISHLQQADQSFTKTKIFKAGNSDRNVMKTVGEQDSVWDEKIPSGYESIVRKYYREIYK